MDTFVPERVRFEIRGLLEFMEYGMTQGASVLPVLPSLDGGHIISTTYHLGAEEAHVDKELRDVTYHLAHTTLLGEVGLQCLRRLGRRPECLDPHRVILARMLSPIFRGDPPDDCWQRIGSAGGSLEMSMSGRDN